MRLLIRCQVAAAAGRVVADAPRWRSTARNIETTRSESTPRLSDGAACASASANAARSAAGGRGVGHRTASMEPVRPRRRTSLSVSRPADPARAAFCASWPAPCRKTVLIRYVACAASPCAQPLPGHTRSRHSAARPHSSLRWRRRTSCRSAGGPFRAQRLRPYLPSRPARTWCWHRVSHVSCRRKRAARQSAHP